MYLMMYLLYEKSFKMLPKTNIVLPFNRQYFRDTIGQLQYDIGVAIQDNAAQHWW